MIHKISIKTAKKQRRGEGALNYPRKGVCSCGQPPTKN